MTTINTRAYTSENSTRWQQDSIHHTTNREESVYEDSNTALDSDIPNIEYDIVIDDNNIKTLNDEDEFGSFDDDDDDDFDDFGSFDENIPLPQPSFDSSKEILDMWEILLNEIYKFKPKDSFTGNATKCIKLFVLEEASESLHSRLTWDSVTKHMDNDTGIPKVRWNQSEIERLHLIALSCKRSTISPVVLDMTNHRPDPIDTSNKLNDSTPTQLPPIITTAPVDTTPTLTTTTTPTSEKRTSLFGLSSLSKYLPHLSKSELPRSPTSPVSPINHSFQSNDRANPQPPSSPLTPYNHPRDVNTTYHNDLYSLQGAFNDMNITSVPQQVTSKLNTNVKRSNTVAFSSRFKDSSIFDLSSSPPRPTTLKHRPTSYHQSTDLFDLDTDVQSLGFNTNFKPLVPTVSSTPLSPIITSHPTFQKDKNSVPVIMDDDFGDFAFEQNNSSFEQNNPAFEQSNPAFEQSNPAFEQSNPAFEDFFANDKKQTPAHTTVNNNDDPFGLNSVMMMSASHSKNKSISSSFTVMSPTTLSPQIMSPTTLSPQIMSPTLLSPQIMSPTLLSPQIMSPTLLSPQIMKPTLVSPQTMKPQVNSVESPKNNNPMSLFDTLVSDQIKVVEEDDDWGDWAF